MEKPQTNIKFIEDMISTPTERWKGNCYGISVICVQQGVVKGKARYGHYLGPIHEKSMFAKMRSVPFCQHGWVELPDGRIWDPTRWVFENVEPYIYIGDPGHAEYDIGGNKFRMASRTPPPEYDAGRKQITLKLGELAMNMVKGLLQDERPGRTFSIDQMFWLGNEDPKTFGLNAKEIYSEFERLQMGAFIPLDNWTLIME